jgi:hypothetical protein
VVTTEAELVRPTPPGPVRASFWILIVSAAFRVFIAILTVASWNSVIDSAMKQVPKGTTRAQWLSDVHTILIANIVLDLVFAGLYVLFAYMVRQGRNWARLTITGIVVLFGLYDIFTSSNLITLISVIVELVAVGLLYLQASKAYFAEIRAQKTQPK